LKLSKQQYTLLLLVISNIRVASELPHRILRNLNLLSIRISLLHIEKADPLIADIMYSTRYRMIVAVYLTSTWLSTFTKRVAKVHTSTVPECQERIAAPALVIWSSCVSIGIFIADSFVYAFVAADSTDHGESHIAGIYQDI
jgi:hypothetical protein